MKPPKLLPIALSLCTFTLGSLHAQQSPEQDDDEIVRLSPFTVQESADMGRYQAAQASSGSRIRMDLMDSTQSISVLTNEFLNDIGTTQLLDAVKYVAGIGNANNPDIMDIINIRGFGSLGATLDGFAQSSLINLDPIIIDRIEVVKGPNAIIAPQGPPGGLVNSVTKRPLFKNSGSVSYQVGRYDANRAEIDANYIIKDDKLALRVVGAFTDADRYTKEKYSQNLTVMPMLTYRISPTTELTAQVMVYNASATMTNIPASFYAVGRSNVHIMEGLSRDFALATRNDNRHESGQRAQFFLTSQLTDKLSMRLAGNWAQSASRASEIHPGRPRDVNGVPIDPEPAQVNLITGEWEWDGVTRLDDPLFIPSGAKDLTDRDSANLQNDFVFEHLGQGWKSQTVAGFAINYSSSGGGYKNAVAVPVNGSNLFDLTDSSFSPVSYMVEPDAEWVAHNSLRNRSHQVYLYQVLNLFDDRLALSGSLSQNRYFSGRTDNLSGTSTEERAEATLASGGIVYKLTSAVSLYYGYSEQEILGLADPNNLIPAHTSPSRQHEGGLRLRLFDGRLYTTFTYFDIKQDGVWEPDAANWIDPTAPKRPGINSNRTAKGFEFEFAWSPTKNISVIGSFTDFKNRDQGNRRYAHVAERMAGIWGSYTFSETGALRGLSFGLGANYVDERPGDSGGQYTTPPQGFPPARYQPLFWLPSYTEVEANATYRFNKHWKAQLVVKNLLDKEFFRSSSNRTLYLSTPFNPKLTVRYEF